MNPLFTLVIAVFAVVLGASCSNGDDQDRTGVPALDEVIEVIQAGEPGALVDRLAMQQLPCTKELGAGGPPKCLPSESEGTAVEVFEFYSCEVNWLRADELAAMADEVFALEPTLFSAFQPPSEYLPAGEYVLLFDGSDPTHDPPQPRGLAVAVTSGRIRAILRACGAGESASSLLPSADVDYLVPPPSE
jgi:hypothetical protein